MDTTPQIKELNAIISEKNTKLGEQAEIIKSLLAEHKEQLEARMDKRPPVGGDTMRLPETTATYDPNNIGSLNSTKFKFSQEEAIAHLKDMASDPTNPNFKEASEIINKAILKTLRANETYELKGNTCRFERRGNRVVKADRKAEFVRVDD